MLDNPLFVGETRLPDDAWLLARQQQQQQQAAAGGTAQQQQQQATGGAVAAASSIFMGQAVNPNPEPDWSSGHRGLCLLAHRLLRPAWDRRVAAARGKDGLLRCTLSADEIEVGVSALDLTALSERGDPGGGWSCPLAGCTTQEDWELVGECVMENVLPLMILDPCKQIISIFVSSYLTH